MTQENCGIEGQKHVKEWLYTKGINCFQAGWSAPFDLYTSAGTRIEVKTSKMRETKPGIWVWAFNIHRHGVVNNENVDVYILRLEPNEILEMYGFESAIHLVIPAPIYSPVISISPRSLISGASDWSRCLGNVEWIRLSDQSPKDIGQSAKHKQPKPIKQPKPKKQRFSFSSAPITSLP